MAPKTTTEETATGRKIIETVSGDVHTYTFASSVSYAHGRVKSMADSDMYDVHDVTVAVGRDAFRSLSGKDAVAFLEGVRSADTNADVTVTIRAGWV